MEPAETNTEITSLEVQPRRFIPRPIFWVVFCLLVVWLAGASFIFLDRFVWHKDLHQLLPENTSLYAVLPLDSQSESYNRVAGHLKHLPYSEKIGSLTYDFLLSSQTVYLPEELDLAEFKNAFGESLAIARVGDSFVFQAEVTDKKAAEKLFNNAGFESDFYTYSGEKIGVYSVAEFDKKFFVWRLGQKLVFSADKSLLEALVVNRRAQQLSYRENWFEQEKASYLHQKTSFLQTFTRLDQNSLIRLYAEPQVLTQAVAAIKQIPTANTLPVTFLEYMASSLSPEPQVLAMGVVGGEFGLQLETAFIPKQPLLQKSVASSESLAQLLPDQLGTAPVDLYLEANDVSQLINNDLNFLRTQDYSKYLSTLSTFKEQFKVDLQDEFYREALQRGALMGAVDAGGAPLVVFVVEHNNQKRARDLGAVLSENLTGMVSDPYYEATENHLIFGTGKSQVLQVKKSLSEKEDKLASHFNNFDYQNQDLVFYLGLEGLVKMARGVIRGTEAAAAPALISNTEVWQSASSLAHILPSLVVLNRLENETVFTTWYLDVKEVSLIRKQEAEKFIDSLTGGQAGQEVDLAAVRDSNRRADLLVLEGAIKAFAGSSDQAPVALTQLVPTYLNTLPTDPQSGLVYAYQNNDSDLSFFVKAFFESTTDLGEPGFYCLTSQGLAFSQSDACVEK